MAALAARGVESGEIDAARLDFKHPGCIACYKCQGSEAYGCHIDDGLARAIATLPDYDVIVQATPPLWPRRRTSRRSWGRWWGRREC